MNAQVYHLKISLMHLDPPIWRTVAVDPATRLDVLHEIIQAAMGWENAHLHAFRSGGKKYTRADQSDDLAPSGDESKFSVGDLLHKKGDHLEYEYDFGDGWQHRVELVAVVPFEAKVILPSVVDGQYACPPEDCGGPWGFTDMMEALLDESNPQHEEIVEWVGADYDPMVFDLNEANERLRELE